MFARNARRRACLLACALVALAASPIPVRAHGGSLVAVIADERSAGNHRAEARRIGEVLFRTVWPAQVRKVRVDGVGTHLIAGLVLSGTHFHRSLTPSGLLDEVDALVSQTFAKSSVEEVDVWAIVPLPTYAHEVVAGDLAQPTSYTVFAATIRRDEIATFADRLRRGDDVYWDPAWRATLAHDSGAGPGELPRVP